MFNVSDDTKITALKNECLAIYLHFTSYYSWRKFLEKYLTGQIKQAFNPLQEVLRKQPGLENVELEIAVYELDFIHSVKQIGKNLITLSYFQSE